MKEAMAGLGRYEGQQSAGPPQEGRDEGSALLSAHIVSLLLMLGLMRPYPSLPVVPHALAYMTFESGVFSPPQSQGPDYKYNQWHSADFRKHCLRMLEG